MRSAKTGIGWVWPGLIGAAGVSVLLFGYVPSEDGTGLFTIVQVVVSTLVAGLGSVIAAHQPGNRIVWLLRATAVGLLLSVAVSLSVEFGAPPVSPGFWDYAAAAVFNVVASLILFPIVLILFVFPTGRFLSRRWTLAGWIAGVFTAVMCFVVLFGDEAGKIYDPESKNWHLTNPIGFLPRGIGEFMTSAAVGVSMWLAVGGVVSMIIRYRRSDSLVRTQIKWVVYASAIAALALALTSFSGGDETIFLVLSLTALSVIPVAITLAITRYQLYEIDRLISRTVSYGLVIALLGGVFATLTWLPSVLSGGVDDGG
ncbi:MAG: hypothetical protein WBM90_03350, partial [Acidimicrobiia bacterium]